MVGAGIVVAEDETEGSGREERDEAWIPYKLTLASEGVCEIDEESIGLHGAHGATPEELVEDPLDFVVARDDQGILVQGAGEIGRVPMGGESDGGGEESHLVSGAFQLPRRPLHEQAVALREWVVDCQHFVACNAACTIPQLNSCSQSIPWSFELIAAESEREGTE